METKWDKLQEIEAARQDIVTKLKRIEDKKLTVRVEVYDKVRKEYEKKLKDIEEKLIENIDLVKREIANLGEEENTLKEQEKEINLKIEEFDLRYSIGEYSDDKFTELVDEDKRTLQEITDKLQKLQVRRKWLESFVEIKGLEKVVETKEEPKEEKVVTVEIDEHILEKKLPEEGKKMDEILVEEIALTETIEGAEKTTAAPSEQKKDKGVACPKCGFMNTLDSWYCEKCGAEILEAPSI